jgi:NTP pyrophosphatase (non-canonical NTP hydrolase)
MHEISKDHGFHDNVALIRPGVVEEAEVAAVTLRQHMGEWIANLHGEVSELWEAYRNRTLFLPCDKACDLTNAEEELADTAIRCMDTAVSLGVDLGRAIRIKSEYNRGRPRLHGGKLA